jgi:hypothetical protein
MIPVVPVVLAGVAAAAGYLTGQRRWKARRRALLARLEAARRAVEPPLVDEAARATLPSPVLHWLAQAIPPGARMIAGVEMAHEGEFDAAASGRPRWGAFASRQTVVAQRPGFLWEARIAGPAGLPVAVHDAYVEGEGVLEAALGGAITLMRQQDPGDLARGELMRFLAEAPLYPTVLLPGQGVRWVEGGQRSAIATLTDGNVRAALQFRFGADGLLESVYADARPRMVGKRVEMTPWEGRWRRWEERSGYLVPLEGEVSWLLPEGWRPYWRGRLTAHAVTAA